MKRLLLVTIASFGLASCPAIAAPVAFVELPGVTGGAPLGTGVFRADLSSVGIANLLSITIADNSAALGGSPGQFSGFDLDAIKLSYTAVATAAQASALVGLNVFDFVNEVIFTPGAQRAPMDAKLFGTGPMGNTVDNAVATLGDFDANSTTIIPGAFGFISLGDNGVLSLNLTAPISTDGLYLYIGEVGNNGEVAAGSITVSDTRVQVPDTSSTMTLVALALAGVCGMRRIRRPGKA
jgi:hypothetical protein